MVTGSESDAGGSDRMRRGRHEALSLGAVNVARASCGDAAQVGKYANLGHPSRAWRLRSMKASAAAADAGTAANGM